MRARNLRWVAVVFVGLSFYQTSSRAVDAVGLDGNWKLLTWSRNSDLIVKLEQKPDGVQGTIVASTDPNPSIQQVTLKGDTISLSIKTTRVDDSFTGKLVRQGDDAGRYLGTLVSVQDRGGRVARGTFPARLERTDDLKVSTDRSEIERRIAQIASQRDVKARVQLCRELLDEYPGNPEVWRVYGELLQSAARAGLSGEEVRPYVEGWLKAVEPYGAEWKNNAQNTALAVLRGEKRFAQIRLELASAAEKALDANASTDQKSTIVKHLLDAARDTGQAELARSTEERWRVLEAKLDQEYLETVPPFAPTPYAGRKTPQDDRVVLMELFTGAQCPPCVAADVGFDALLKTYPATSFTALQYHLHIPGPDPLTNQTAVDRAAYYQVNSTPTTIFNGSAQGRGGGPMDLSQQKYDEYRQIVDAALEGGKQATIDLQVKRSGDELELAVSAEAKVAAVKADVAAAEATGDKQEPAEPTLRLRLVLVEEHVRYAGGNRLRYHHHVVRAMPGGVEGLELVEGRCQKELKFDLAGLRQELDSYLSSAAAVRPFPKDLPAIELKALSVVAFVQNDTDKSIWHCVLATVPE